MEYSTTDIQFIYDLCNGLNLLAQKFSLNGRFIPEVLITNAGTSFKCFKNLHFSLFFLYKSQKNVILTQDYVGKSVEGSLKDAIKMWNLLVTSMIMKWLAEGGFQKLIEENGRAE